MSEKEFWQEFLNENCWGSTVLFNGNNPIIIRKDFKLKQDDKIKINFWDVKKEINLLALFDDEYRPSGYG